MQHVYKKLNALEIKRNIEINNIKYLNKDDLISVLVINFKIINLLRIVIL